MLKKIDADTLMSLMRLNKLELIPYSNKGIIVIQLDDNGKETDRFLFPFEDYWKLWRIIKEKKRDENEI